MDRSITITVPYSSALSDNVMHLSRGGGGKYKNPATKAEQERICYMLRGERARLGQVWENIKTHVEITVYRPDMVSDPSNFQKAVVDGVKLGIEVDDRHYEASTKWEMDKEDPRIEITVWQ